jgi:hypothetical protein
MFDNESRGVPEGEVVPRPLHEDHEPVTKADQIHEMDKEPDQPGQEAARLQAPQISHRRGAAAGGHGAPISVVERLGRLAFQEPAPDLSRRVHALLHNHRGEPR